ncbi:MAG: hypothetical protein M4579_000596 [Chaenotheca gracillima]|nr:MAG: hypothetical protein M4579_000596 [Chaenotheca gracillima]
MAAPKSTNVADIIVESLWNAGVRLVFGIPGAKIDSIFEKLLDHPQIRLIVCRHEQNAAFMAAAVGRLTGRPGVCIATSGPGATNLATGLATATTEGDPVVALIGSVPRLQSLKHTHQSLRAIDVLGPVSKSAVDILVEDQVAEVMLDAFRTAEIYPQGSTVISLPMDLSKLESRIPAFSPDAFIAPSYGLAAQSSLQQACQLLRAAKFPVLFLGMRSADPTTVHIIRNFLRKHPMPVVETFQAAGAISKDLLHLFFGRIGLFRNQPGDKLLAKSDLVLTVGYDSYEYDANQWNPSAKLDIVHIDYKECDYGFYYKPKVELPGSIPENFKQLTDQVTLTSFPEDSETCQTLHKEFSTLKNISTFQEHGLVHPLHFIAVLQKHVSEETRVISDIGTVYIWLMRHFFSYQPRHFLSSNGQQTLGVGLPWAIAASLVQDPPCSQKVISLSGDGGFMFSSQELSTAVQQGCNITHFIWNDGKYNMVEFQEELKYGRSAGVDLGGVDFVKFAESFNAKGFRVSDSAELEQVMQQALDYQGVSIVDVQIDYSHNRELAGNLIPEEYD